MPLDSYWSWEHNAAVTRFEREQREKKEVEEKAAEDRKRMQGEPVFKTAKMIEAETVERNRIMANAMDGQRRMRERGEL